MKPKSIKVKKKLGMLKRYFSKSKYFVNGPNYVLLSLK